MNVLSVISVAAVIFASVAAAQSVPTLAGGTWLAGASGTSVTVTAVLIDTATLISPTRLDSLGNFWPIVPYMQSNVDLANSSIPLYWLVSLGAQGYAPVYNFTATESAAIGTWLTGVAYRTNVEIVWTATFGADMRATFPANLVTAWTFSGLSLVPYTNSPTCSPANSLACVAATFGNVAGRNCGGETGTLNDFKACFAAADNCFATTVRVMFQVKLLCENQRSTLDSICLDGADGSAAVCAFGESLYPSGMTLAPGSPPIAGINQVPAPKKASSAVAIGSLLIAAAAALAL